MSGPTSPISPNEKVSPDETTPAICRLAAISEYAAPPVSVPMTPRLPPASIVMGVPATMEFEPLRFQLAPASTWMASKPPKSEPRPDSAPLLAAEANSIVLFVPPPSTRR